MGSIYFNREPSGLVAVYTNGSDGEGGLEAGGSSEGSSGASHGTSAWMERDHRVLRAVRGTCNAAVWSDLRSASREAIKTGRGEKKKKKDQKEKKKKGKNNGGEKEKKWREGKKKKEGRGGRKKKKSINKTPHPRSRGSTGRSGSAAAPVPLPGGNSSMPPCPLLENNGGLFLVRKLQTEVASKALNHLEIPL